MSAGDRYDEQAAIEIAEVFDAAILEADEENSLRDEHDDWPDRPDLIEWYKARRHTYVSMRDEVLQILKDRFLGSP